MSIQPLKNPPVVSYRGLIAGIAAMAVIVTTSNILVGFPINDWLTWGAFSFPATFLIVDLINRSLGPQHARIVACAGFIIAVAMSFWLATPRIALGSGMAFIVGQMTDISIFHHLRNKTWWQAPLISSSIASAIDTVIFFSIAFAGTGLPWVTLAIGDYGVKLAVTVFLLIPFYALMGIIPVEFRRTQQE